MIFCFDTGVPHSSIEDKALERIVRHSRQRSIPIIDSKHGFKFGDTFVKSRGMIELTLSPPGSTLDIPVILDVVDVVISPLLGLDVLDVKNVLSKMQPMTFGTE